MLKPETEPTEPLDLSEWLSEAWATGLLESPNYESLDEHDLARILHLSSQHKDPSTEADYRLNADRLGVKLAYSCCGGVGGEADDDGEEDATVGSFRDLNDLISDEDHDCETPIMKRPRLSHRGEAAVTAQARPVVLDPAWVLLCNCLLDHGCLSVLKVSFVPLLDLLLYQLPEGLIASTG